MTQALTMPGLALAAISGFALVWISRLSPARHRWLAMHAGLAVVAGILVAALLLPAGRRRWRRLAPPQPPVRPSLRPSVSPAQSRAH